MTSDAPKQIRRRVRPKSWPARLKFHASSLWGRLFGKPLFRLDLYEIFGDPPRWQEKLTLWRHHARDTNILYALYLLAFCVAVLIAWGTLAPNVLPNERVEFVGLIFDIIFILVLFAIFEHRRQNRLDARWQQEIIDDYKKWNSDEARFRIAGAIRRLIASGQTGIDFGGIELRDFSFRRHDIKNIRGSTFYDGPGAREAAGTRSSSNESISALWIAARSCSQNSIRLVALEST